MNMNLIKDITSKQLKKDVPAFSSGDTVKVHVRIVEGNKERVQIFQGVVISKHGSGISESFTVRKISSNVGVERVFQVHSPLIAKIEVIKRGSVRRTKLFYLRGKEGHAANVDENKKLTAETLAAAKAAEDAKKAAIKAEEEAKKAAEEAAKKAAEEAAKKAEEEAKKAAEQPAPAPEAPKAEEAK